MDVSRGIGIRMRVRVRVSHSSSDSVDARAVGVRSAWRAERSDLTRSLVKGWERDEGESEEMRDEPLRRRDHPSSRAGVNGCHRYSNEPIETKGIAWDA